MLNLLNLSRFPGTGEKEVVCAGELHSLQAAAALCPVHEASVDRWTRRVLSILLRVAKRWDPTGCCGASAEPGTPAGEPLDEGRMMWEIAQKAAARHHERGSPTPLRETSAVGTKGSRPGGGRAQHQQDDDNLERGLRRVSGQGDHSEVRYFC